ncbi:hypothetical protein TYRP_010237 [Tyrophagus putrescentiae]|nr:hypothetical protein TYRP_010237 [Tyrophagus putrescentiae]
MKRQSLFCRLLAIAWHVLVCGKAVCTFRRSSVYICSPTRLITSIGVDFFACAIEEEEEEEAVSSVQELGGHVVEDIFSSFSLSWIWQFFI